MSQRAKRSRIMYLRRGLNEAGLMPDKPEEMSANARKIPAGTRKKKRQKRKVAKRPAKEGSRAKFPRHSLAKSLRVPRAILDQNAGRPCTEAEAAAFVGVGIGGPFRVEISSAIKYGLL